MNRFWVVENKLERLKKFALLFESKKQPALMSLRFSHRRVFAREAE